MGIIEEGKSAMEELEGSVLDAALIAGAQRAEHYEIAATGRLPISPNCSATRRPRTCLGQTLRRGEGGGREALDDREVEGQSRSADGAQAWRIDEEQEDDSYR
jgi:hypothetical protein